MVSSDYVQCVACKGVYRPLQADGTTYFHACPPTVVTTEAVVDPITGDVIKPAIVSPIINARNENIRVDPDTGKVSILAAGAGVVPVPPPAPLSTPDHR